MPKQRLKFAVGILKKKGGQEVRMVLRSRREVSQKSAASIVFHKPTFCLKKAKLRNSHLAGSSILPVMFTCQQLSSNWPAGAGRS
ncbi:hypothetical protein AVEN_113547-1 [Araneus ventricosus]|uniref:Uncharacterized protein n=1 Tax=Araneus ventricosus TaxID=182803 RepID=A0A4Y2G3G9_ARAVE|nr:hypothetical protein AVEN_113547-1 [Araneus ventricosus]